MALTALQRLRAKSAPQSAPQTAPAEATPPPVQAPEPVQQPVVQAPVQQPAVVNPALASLLSTPVVQPVQVQQQPAQPTVQTLPTTVTATTAAPVVISAPVVVSKSGNSLAQMNPELAREMLRNMRGVQASYADIIVAAAADAESSPMIAMKQPFARIKEGNWEVLKDKYDADVYKSMPVGDRPYLALYIGHRVGAIGWEGAPSKVGGKMPMFKYAIGNLREHPSQPGMLLNNEAAGILVTATQFVASRVMFTKSAERTKFDSAGRLTSEIHVLVWRPDTGYIILMTQGFKGVKNTIEGFDQTKLTVGLPYTFGLETEQEFNKKGTDEKKNKEWKSYWISATLDGSEEGQKMRNAGIDNDGRDPIAALLEVNGFLTGLDYEGLSEEQIYSKLDSYSQIIERNVFNEQA